MNKLERLLNLTTALLNAKRPLTASDLREKVGGYPDGDEAFLRCFARDKDDLRRIGLKISLEDIFYTDPPVKGYRLSQDAYKGTEMQFEPDELTALHLATSLIALDGDDTGLIKLGAGSAITSVDPVGELPFDNNVGSLIAAAANRQAVTFKYHNIERKVEPWRVSFNRGRWYLAGWDHTRKGVRIYRVDRLEGAVKLGGPATEKVGEIPNPLDFRGWELGDGPVEVARVRIDRDRAEWVGKILNEVEAQDDGSVVATLEVRNRGAFRAFVLNFLEHAEVLEPPDLRADFIKWLENLR